MLPFYDKNGFTRVFFENESVYEGSMVNGKMQGFGCYTW